MDVLVTYDLHGSHANKAIKNAMIQKGYFDFWHHDNKIVSLPNTTLWKKNIELTAALEDLKEAIRVYNLANGLSPTRLVRGIATPATPWNAIVGDPHQ